MSIFLQGQPDPDKIRSLLRRETIQMALLLEMQFVSGTVYASDWNVPLVDAKWGHTWEGYGDLVSMSDVAGGSESLAPVREYNLGIPWEYLSPEERAVDGMGRVLAMIGNAADYRGRLAILYMQLFDTDQKDAHGRPVPVGYPFALDSGLMDRASTSYSRQSAVISMRVEGYLARKGAPVFGLMTDRDQARRHPGDKGLRYVTEVMTTNPQWTNF